MNIEVFDVVGPCEEYLMCDFCYTREWDIPGWMDDLHYTGMYRMRHGCLICEECLANGADREEESQGDAD